MAEVCALPSALQVYFVLEKINSAGANYFQPFFLSENQQMWLQPARGRAGARGWCFIKSERRVKGFLKLAFSFLYYLFDL